MSRRNLLPISALVFLALLLAACGGTPAPPPLANVTLTTVVSGLSNPLDLQRPPGDSRFFVVEQPGTIRIVENGALLPGDFLDIRSLTNFDGAEQGLLGLAFHPNYSTNRLFYVNYTRDTIDPQNPQETVIAEFQTDAANPNHADPASKRELLNVSQPFTNHKGGQLAFGPDRLLYLGLGDGGSGGDPLGNGQNLGVLLGKILRIDVDGGLPYGIPPDNPFVGGAGLPEIWAYGLRNPWRFSFERGGTRLFCGDVGQSSFEEVDLIAKGGNFGWNVMEGAHCFSPSSGCDMTNKILPIAEYSHSEGIAIIGGYVYKGSISALANAYIFGDLTGKIWTLAESPANTFTRTQLLSTGRTISSFGQDSAGEVYVVDLNGAVLKLVAQ